MRAAVPTPTHRSAREDPTTLLDGLLQIVSTHHKDPRQDVDRSRPGLELVLLDMDGTLIEGSSWEIVHKAFGVSNEHNWERYQRGELTDQEFIRSDIEMWHLRGGPKKHVDDIERALADVHLFPGAKELAASLRARGIATCIVSGGLDILARRVCEETGIDMYVANGIRLEPSGHVHGDGLVFVELRDKGKVAREILKRLGVPRERAASVGNSAYDVPMFRETGFGIAVNPSDDDVRRGARHVVEGKDLRDVLRILVS